MAATQRGLAVKKGNNNKKKLSLELSRLLAPSKGGRLLGGRLPRVRLYCFSS